MKIISFFKLKPAEKVVFFQSLYWVLYFRLRLHHMPLKLLINQVVKKSEGYFFLNKSSKVSANEIAWAIKRASSFVPGSTCLVQALAGKVVFSSQGYQSTIKIGVKKNVSSGISSHAWLEHEGNTVIGRLLDIGLHVQIIKLR